MLIDTNWYVFVAIMIIVASLFLGDVVGSVCMLFGVLWLTFQGFMFACEM